jgi:hypothetical protein
VVLTVTLKHVTGISLKRHKVESIPHSIEQMRYYRKSCNFPRVELLLLARLFSIRDFVMALGNPVPLRMQDIMDLPPP